MKKRIVLSNGVVREMECNEEFLKMFRALAVSELAKYRNGSVVDVTEDEKQELDIVIYKAFVKYNEVNAFSTLLVWEVKSYGHSLNHAASTQKRDSKDYKFVDLDYKLNSGKGDAEKAIHDVIGDESENIEAEYEENDMISYILKRCNEVEKELLFVYLEKQQFIDVCEKLGKSKSNLSNQNKRFKERLKGLIAEYNKTL